MPLSHGHLEAPSDAEQGFKLLRRLLGAETPSQFVSEFSQLAIVHGIGEDNDAGFGLFIDGGGLGRWNWGGNGLPLVDADLSHGGQALGRLLIRGDENSPLGQTLGKIGPLVVPTVSRLLAIQEAEHRATVDGLTGIMNRSGVEKRISEELQRSRRNGLPLTLMLLDVDDMKGINDAHGHQQGDRALNLVADVLVSATRGSDLVGRFGGDEFVALLPETSGPAAKIVAHRMIRELAASARAPNVSIGLTESQDGDSCEQLLRRADEAMYSVKGQGRDSVAAA